MLVNDSNVKQNLGRPVLSGMKLMIDTHRAAKLLQQAGFNEEQASVVTNLFSNTIPWEELVTKEHLTHALQALRFDLAGELKALEDRTDQRSAKINRRLDNVEQRINQLEIKMEQRFADHDARFSALDARITQVKHELLEQIHKHSVSQTRWLIGAIFVIQSLQFALGKVL